MKWFDANTATKADVPGYWCLGFNDRWSDPKVRVGCFDMFDDEHRFQLIGGPHMELAPSHVARLPQYSEKQQQ